MSNRPALVTQADVKRVIRACQAAGLTVVRVIVKHDGVQIETSEDSSFPASPQGLDERPPAVL